jgi:hypothetical protein
MIERLMAEETGKLSILRRLSLTGRAFSFADNILSGCEFYKCSQPLVGYEEI